MKVKEVIALITADGWFFKRQKGSHRIYGHPTRKGIVVVPDHGAAGSGAGNGKQHSETGGSQVALFS